MCFGRKAESQISPLYRYIYNGSTRRGILSTSPWLFPLNTLQTAVLHDTVEDTDTTPEEIGRHFGSEVKDLVAEVTDDKSLSKLERKRLQVCVSY